MPRFCTKVLGLEAIFVDFKNIFSAITLGKMRIRLFDDCFLYFFLFRRLRNEPRFLFPLGFDKLNLVRNNRCYWRNMAAAFESEIDIV